MARISNRRIEKDLNGRPIEPQPDYHWMDSRQFLNWRLQRAIRSGKSYNEHTVMRRARIDWNRLQRTERQRQARTKSLSDPSVPQPITPHFLDALTAKEVVDHILKSVDRLLCEALRIRYLEGYCTKSAAKHFGVTARYLRTMIAKAFKQARSVPM